ncbi:hypothetical protein [Polyangium aurulentum]|uniref:hypothetical protein n=1 Tax=Polyangium aurulentum TaxID=2567896 RepID=UPI0010AE2B58|nr:hypothetical protein [Polyangium aurulentum]UQA54657.1 hypothetical protein E8A73_025120 [Polyangium aurulentum]
MSDEETLLSNADGTIVAEGPLVLVCVCEAAMLELGVRLISTFALVASTIIALLVALRAAPWPILLIAITWTTGVVAANVFVRRRRWKHGRFRVDFDRGEIVHEGRGFTRKYPLGSLQWASIPVVGGPEGAEGEEGFEMRWLVLHLEGGRELRLGKGPGHALRPAVAFLRKAGIEVRVGSGQK